MQKFRFVVHADYHRYGLHYNVLSGPIISCFTRTKRVNEQIICLCTSSVVYMQNFRFIGAMVSEFRFFKRRRREDEEEEEEEEEHGQSVKIMFACISYLL